MEISRKGVSEVRRIAFSGKMKSRIRIIFLLMITTVMLLLCMRIGRRSLYAFCGKLITACLYEKYLPVAVYDRDILLTDIFTSDDGELGYRFPHLVVESQEREEKKEIQEKESVPDESLEELEMLMLTENSLFWGNEDAEEAMEDMGEERESMPANVEETEALENRALEDKPVQKAKINPEDYILYEKLIRDFYTVDPNTTANSEMINVKALMGIDMKVEKNTDGPQILIYHTHSQEAFSDSIKGDSGTSIVGVGQHLADLLTDKYGYRVLHHTGEYDKKTRDDAYTNALPEIEALLKENPSIQVVIDLHRDEMPEKTRLATEVDGKQTAKFMFFNGLSWSKKTGQISYLKNPYLQENLAFSFQLQKKANEYYPGLARRIYLKQYRYNMHVCPKATLIELGAQNNTVEEAMNACEPLAAVLDLVLRGEE